MVHEAGHALVAVLVGRRLQSIRLHSDTSGLTVSRGKPRGPGMVVMLAAGYLAPALLGLVAALLLAAGRSVGLLWLLVVLTAVLLLWVRNGYGFLVLLVGGAGVLLLTWYGDGTVQSVAAYLIAWLLLLAAPRPLLELLAGGRRRGRTSDPDQLAGLTRVPAVVWILLLLAGQSGRPRRGRQHPRPGRRLSADNPVVQRHGHWLGLSVAPRAPREVRARGQTVPTGKVKWFDAEKGFGFLSQEDGPDVYVRADALPEGVTTLKAGTRVEFGIAQGRRGDQALQVRVLDAPASVQRNQSHAKRKKPDEMVPIVEDLIRAARRRRRGLPARPAPGPQHGAPDRQAAAGARRRARALAPSSLRRASAGSRHRPARRARCGLPAPAARRRRSTNTVHAASAANATPSPSRGGSSGSAMPTKPPITQASWQVVSLRANALACTRVRDVALDGRVEGELRQRLARARRPGRAAPASSTP